MFSLTSSSFPLTTGSTVKLNHIYTVIHVDKQTQYLYVIYYMMDMCMYVYLFVHQNDYDDNDY